MKQINRTDQVIKMYMYFLLALGLLVIAIQVAKALD